MIILNHPQGSEEWKLSRAGIATASCFGDIMAKIKSGEAAVRINYRARLVVERLTGRPVSTFETPAMRQGREREPDARMAYMIRTGVNIEQVGLCRHDTIECGASPDGLIDANGGFEAKCPELAKHLEYLRLPKNEAPPEYRWQVQGGLWITEREWWDFASWNPEYPEKLQLVIRRVYRDEPAIKQLAGEVERFMAEVREEEERIRNLPLAA